MTKILGTLDADGIMVRAAGIIGRHHARLGVRPDRRWFTHARQSAYLDAYRAALSANDGDAG